MESKMSYTVELPVVEHNGVTLNPADYSLEQIERAVVYLFQYGFAKSLQDSVAGHRKARLAEGASEDEVNEEIRLAGEERRDAILNGTLNARGPRLTSEAAIRRDVIEELFRLWAKKAADAGKGKLPRAPKGATESEKKAVAEKIKALKERFANANADKIASEVERRLELQGEGDELDLDF
jgi:hypothetical protein